MPNFNNFHFRELKDILIKNKNGDIKISKEDELEIRKVMRKKLLSTKTPNIIVDTLKDERYNTEIKKDTLNNSLIDRMNNDISLSKMEKPDRKKLLIEIPYDSVEPINKQKNVPLGINLERGFKKVTCSNSY